MISDWQAGELPLLARMVVEMDASIDLAAGQSRFLDANELYLAREQLQEARYVLLRRQCEARDDQDA